jgi:hypothetical protein
MISCSKNVQYLQSNNLVLNDSGYFETRGLNYFVFSNMYDAAFDDSKVSAVEIIHHGIRTATNGDVRLNSAPGQWDPLPVFVERKIDSINNRIEITLNYPKYDFTYRLAGEARDGAFFLSVITDQPIPAALEGVAGLNMEFFPPVFWEHSFVMDNRGGLFPVSAANSSKIINGQAEPKSIAEGKKIEIAPDEPLKHLTITATDDNKLQLFDGRTRQQNGNFVLRTLLPAGKTGKIAEWRITAETQENWLRTPNIAHSQAGYLPEQEKIAVIELDKNDKPLSKVSLLKINNDGSVQKILTAKPKVWGIYTRYNYLQFDFSQISETGIYAVEYAGQRTAPFPISSDVYERVWYPSLDVFMAVQMDHVFVRDAYRVWHGASHLDDALQAPETNTHWDGWRQGKISGKYKALQHVPGLNVGGWFDAGDFDIQTPRQQTIVDDFTQLWETFGTDRDENTINQKTRYVDIHVPDGKPDVLQQIEHGVLQLAGQVNAFGHAILGINESHLYQYRHLGDALTKTDNVVSNPKSDPDDRWAFTNRSPILNYGSTISLAASSRALKGYNDALSREALSLAEMLWKSEHIGKSEEMPQMWGRFNPAEYVKTLECRAAYELWISTEKDVYKNSLDTLLSFVINQFDRNIDFLARIIPLMSPEFKEQIKPHIKQYAEKLAEIDSQNPFGVDITERGWAGNHAILKQGFTNYLLRQSFPELIDIKYVYRPLNYIFGCHPYHNLSFVSGVGAQPKKIAYGNNRADFTFIPGGIVPGVRILKPDFPENRDDYPFHWSENEYVVDVASEFILLVNAVNSLSK